MRKFWLLMFLLFVTICPSLAQQYMWRYRTAADCTALTDGKITDLCYQTDQKLYKCVPVSGDCDTAAEWKLTAGTETDPIWESEKSGYQVIGNYIESESDPIWESEKSGYQPVGNYLTAEDEFPASGINWADYFDMPAEAINWTDFESEPFAAINWTDGMVPDTSINWDDMVALYDEVGAVTNAQICQGDGSAVQCNIPKTGTGDAVMATSPTITTPTVNSLYVPDDAVLGPISVTRSATNPATYVDDNGIIQLSTTSNTPRFQGGYYDETGFHTKKGLMVEAAGTNKQLWSYFPDSYGSILMQNWNIIQGSTGTITQTLVSDGLSHVPQYSNGGIVFDGIEDQIIIPYAEDLLQDVFSVFIDITFDSLTNTKDVTFWGQRRDGYGDPNWYLNLELDAPYKNHIGFGYVDTTGTGHGVHSNDAVVIGNRYKIVGVISKSGTTFTARMYVNGVLQTASASWETNGVRTTDPGYLCFGKGSNPTTTEVFDGTIYDARFFSNVSITQEDVTTLNSNGIVGTETSKWNFSTGSGTTLQDTVGTNHGELQSISAQRLQLTSSGGANKSDIVYYTSPANTLTNATTYTASIYLKGSATGATGLLLISTLNAAADTILENFSVNIVPTALPSRHTITFTTDHADTSRYFFVFGASQVDTGDVYDLSFSRPQLELGPYATSFIPTTTNPLTRNAEIVQKGLVLNSGLATIAQNSATTNAVTDVVTVQSTTTGTAADGIGAGMVFKSEDASGNVEEIANIDAVNTTAAHATQAAKLSFGVLGAAEVGKFISTGLTLTTGKNLTVGTTQWNAGDSISGAGINWVDVEATIANMPTSINWIDLTPIFGGVETPAGLSETQSLAVGTKGGAHILTVDENGMLGCNGQANCGINWDDFEKIVAEGINWTDIKSQEMFAEGINWTDYQSTPSGAINWALADEIQSGSINWGDMYNVTEDVNWGGRATYAGTGQSEFPGGIDVNWTLTTQLTNDGVNWTDIKDNTLGINWYDVFQCGGAPCF